MPVRGKTPYSIGKELTAMIERLFEANIPMNTLRDRAYRMQKKIDGNQSNPVTPEDDCEIKKNLTIPKINNLQVGNMGHREGAGRPSKYQRGEIKEEMEGKPKTHGGSREGTEPKPKYQKEKTKEESKESKERPKGELIFSVDFIRLVVGQFAGGGAFGSVRSRGKLPSKTKTTPIM